MFQKSLIKLLFLVSISGNFVKSESPGSFYFPDYDNPGKIIKADLKPPRSFQVLTEDASKVHFLLFTKDNPEDPQEIVVGDTSSVINSNFKPNEKLNLLVHGFNGNYTKSFPWDLRNLYLQMEEWRNVVLIDWSHLSSWNYFAAVQYGKLCSSLAKDFLEFLLKEEFVHLDDIHVLGHSLGAQVVGQIGYKMNGTLPRITASDPARPLFDVAELEDRIDPSDAKFVDVIHTAALIVTFVEPQGHADFYPNGGWTQPGCGLDPIGSCAHARSPILYEESVFNPQGFEGFLCSSWEDYMNGACYGNEIAYMGEHVDLRARGSFYFETNASPPYAKNDQS